MCHLYDIVGEKRNEASCFDKLDDNEISCDDTETAVVPLHFVLFILSVTFRPLCFVLFTFRPITFRPLTICPNYISS